MSDSRIESTDVLIVGGGPSGLISALLLAKLGVRSIVLERNRATDDHPKAHELNARSIEIVREVGITEEDLAKEASPMEDASRILFCRRINEEFGRIDLLDDPKRRDKYVTHLRQTLPYMNLSQSEFEKILVGRVQACPLAELRFEHQWKSFEEMDDGTVSTIEANGDCYQVDAKYLLGCDGVASRVRKAIGIEMDGPREMQSFVNAFFKADLRAHVTTPAKLYWLIHPAYAGTLVAHHMGKRWVYAVPVQKPYEKPEDFTKEIMRERIVGALGFDVPGLDIVSLSTWHMTAQIAQAYRRGRAILVGDAAHRFPPTGGLGMNTGIADAHNVCWKIASVMKGEADDALLDTYEAERRPVAIKNCDESRHNFEKIFEVLEALGLDPEGLEKLARVMNAAPIRWLPVGARNAIRKFVTSPIFALVGRGLKPGHIRDKVQTAIAAQTNHFDRIGLDIGYIYDRGAFIDDGSKAPTPLDEVSEYIPTTKPGARLPHVLHEEKSTHDDIDYAAWTLFTPTSKTSDGDHLRVVDSSPLPDDIFPADTAILVRPDGHIAWRGAAREFDFQQILNQIHIGATTVA